MSCTTLIRNLSCDVSTGGFVSAPQMVFAAKLKPLGADYLITGLFWNTSLINFGTEELGAFFVIGRDAPTLAFSDSLLSPVFSVTLQNSFTGPPDSPIPARSSPPITFREPIPVTATTPLSLYVFGANTTTPSGSVNRVVAHLALFLVKGK